MSKRLAWSLVAVVSLGLAGAGTLVSSQAQAAPALVKTASAHILVNARGMTLYVFAIDKPNKSVCTGECAKFWPPLVLPKGMKVPTTMSGISGKFGVAMRAGAVRQLTFDGAPLYTFIKDKEAGDMYGQGLLASGGYWWVVAVSVPKASTSPSTGRYGY